MAELPVIEKVDPELNKQLLQDFRGERTGFVQVGPDKFFFPVKYEKVAKELSEFKVRPDDTWLISFPRTGTTLCQELIWMLLNNLDIETAEKVDLSVRFPYLEFNILFHDEFIAEMQDGLAESPDRLLLVDALTKSTWKDLEAASSPRLIKTHLPIQLLPTNLLTSGAKVIYVTRHPKDVAASWYHLYKLVKHLHYVGDFQKFWHYFENNLTIWSPYWPHVIEAWKNRNNNNMHFVFFEDYIKNPAEFISKMSNFLNKSLTNEEVTKLVDYLKFENFRNNASVNKSSASDIKITHENPEPYVRKGKVGDWCSEFTPELSARADKWIEENLKKTDLKFPTL